MIIMIKFEKAMIAAIQTICVGGLCVAVIATNADKIDKDFGMIPAALVGITITSFSGITSLMLAEE